MEETADNIILNTNQEWLEAESSELSSQVLKEESKVTDNSRPSQGGLYTANSNNPNYPPLQADEDESTVIPYSRL